MLKLTKLIMGGENFKVDKLLKLKVKCTIFISIFFVIFYKGAEFYTYTVDNVPSYFMEWERNIPFLPVFMLPYMTSAPYFLATIFLEKNENSLKLLMKRAIFLTVVSTFIFVITCIISNTIIIYFVIAKLKFHKIFLSFYSTNLKSFYQIKKNFQIIFYFFQGFIFI